MDDRPAKTGRDGAQQWGGRCVAGRQLLRLGDQALLRCPSLAVYVMGVLEFVLQWVDHRDLLFWSSCCLAGSIHNGQRNTNSCLFGLPAWLANPEQAG